MSEDFSPLEIDGYKIKAEISNNGRTRVYFASDPTTGSDVVLKMLSKDYFSDPEFRSQFEAEILALSDLEVDEIVPIYRIGVFEDQPYLVMRFMPSGSLTERIMAGPMALDKVVEITLRLAIALDAAHEIGVLHRNIKSSNVLFDDKDQAYLSDFCQVKRSYKIGEGIITIIDGNPTCISPEQALGRMDLDARSDIYSLGAMVYEMLAGQPAFPGINPVTQAIQHVTSNPQSIMELRPDLPAGCAAAIGWAMSKDPSKRYRTAGEFALVLEQQATIPGIYSHQIQKAKKAKRRPVQLFLLLGLLIALLSVVLLLSWYQIIPEPYNAIAYIYRTPSSTPTLSLPTSTPTLTRSPTSVPPTSTITFTLTPSPLPPTATPIYTPTRTPWVTNIPLGPIIGFSDQIAFLSDNEVWLASLDGKNVVKITSDGGSKSDLEWTPDGKALTFQKNGCYKMLMLDSRETRDLGCYNDFEISPDMIEVVIAGKVRIEANRNMQWYNFMMPYDMDLLSSRTVVSQESEYGGCTFVGGSQLQFSTKNDTMAAVFGLDQGLGADVITLFDMEKCGDLDPLVSFPGQWFRLRGPLGTNTSPRIKDFGWDGDALFAVHGDYLNGYGEMVIFKRTETNISWSPVLYPVNGKCCYQDIQFSPDGSFILFTFQDAEIGIGAEIYYVPYDWINNMIVGQDARNKNGPKMTPIPLPKELFDNNTDQRIEPALRPYLP